jgi:histone H3
MNRTTPVKVQIVPAKVPGAPVKPKSATQKPKPTIVHKKILKDNLQGITNGAIQRMAHKGGVKYLSALSYEEVRQMLKDHLEKVISKSLIFTDHNRRRVVMERDVREALKSMGRPSVFGDGRQVNRQLGNGQTRVVKQHSKPPTTVCVGYLGKRRTYHGNNPNADVQKKFHIGGDLEYNKLTDDLDAYDPNLLEDEMSDDQEPYDPYDRTKYVPYNANDDAYNANNLDDNETPYDPEPPSDNEDDDQEYDVEDDSAILPQIEEDGQLGGAKKPYKFHPGTVALRRIRYYQKQAGHCFNISKVGFRRLVREIAQDYKHNVRFTLDAMIIFQLDAENYIVSLCSDAILCTLHRSAVRVYPKDFQLVKRLRKNTF